MSTVERALRKLREARGGDQPPPQPTAPIARVSPALPEEADGSSTASGQIAGAGKGIEFNLTALEEAGLLSASNRVLAEQYRAIKQPLLRIARMQGTEREHLGNLLMVASALAGEGKTFTCVNLSLSLASEKDWSVLLVDVDCQNPQLSRLLGVDGEPGLMELLRDPNANPESFVLSTNIKGLSIMPIGSPDAHASELLASARMTAVCKLLSERYPRQITVFDSSPLLLTTESSILGGNVGQIVVVVRANKTPQAAVMEAIQKLDSNKAIGMVLNQATVMSSTVDYGAYGTYPYTSD